MANEFATLHKKNTSFIITNNLTKTINIFGIKIRSGTNYDLMNLPGISETEIKSSLEKGDLFTRLTNGDISVVSTNCTFFTSDSTQLAFLTAKGLLPDNASKIYANQTTWYINSSTGLDTNDGLTSVTPIKTVDEFYKRIGPRWKLAGNTTLNLSGTFTSLQLDVYDPTSTFTLTIVGTLTELVASTVTASVAQTASTNTPNSVTTGISSYSDYINKLIVVTSGARSGRRSRISADLGSGEARLDDIMTSAYTAGQTPFLATDPVSIYDVTNISSLKIEHECGLIMSFVSAPKCIIQGRTNITSFLRDCSFGTLNTSFSGYIAAIGSANIITQNCVFFKTTLAGNVTIISGGIPDSVTVNPGAAVQLFGTVILRALNTAQMIIINPGGNVSAAQSVGVIGCTTGIFVDRDALLNIGSTLWGSGNTTIINIRNTYSRMSYTNAALLTATGTNQILLVQVSKAFSDLPLTDSTHQAFALING